MAGRRARGAPARYPPRLCVASQARRSASPRARARRGGPPRRRAGSRRHAVRGSGDEPSPNRRRPRADRSPRRTVRASDLALRGSRDARHARPPRRGGRCGPRGGGVDALGDAVPRPAGRRGGADGPGLPLADGALHARARRSGHALPRSGREARARGDELVVRGGDGVARRGSSVCDRRRTRRGFGLAPARRLPEPGDCSRAPDRGLRARRRADARVEAGRPKDGLHRRRRW